MNTPQDIVSDLQFLYYKTKNKKIENLFLIAAEQFSTESLVLKDIFKILGNFIPKNINVETWNALKTLVDIGSVLGSAASYHSVSQYFLKRPDAFSHYPIFKIFYELLNEGKFVNLFSTFNGILAVTETMDIKNTETGQSVQSPVPKNEVEKDILNIIESVKQINLKSNEEMYNDIGELIHKKKKQTKKDKILELLEWLIKEFNNELSSCATKLGMHNLSTVVSSRQILNPIAIFKAFSSPNNIGNHIGVDSKKVIGVIIKNINSRTPEEQYNFIRNRAMIHGGALTVDEYKAYYMQQIEKKYSESKEPDDLRIEFSANQLINYNSVLFISFVLYGLSEKTKE